MDYIVKRDMTKWSLHPDSLFQREEKEEDKSVIRTDQGEYVTGAHKIPAIFGPARLPPYYPSEIAKENDGSEDLIKEDPKKSIPHSTKSFREMDD